jgi:hypothetical protein
MYRAVRRHRLLFRTVAGFVAFLFVYLGFIAAFHHTDGPLAIRLAPQSPSLNAFDVPSSKAVDAESKDCRVCAFLANLVSPAFALAPPALATPSKALALPAGSDIYIGDIPSAHAPRAPPTA